MSIRTIRKVLRMGAPVYSDTSLHLVHVGTYEIHPLSNAYMYVMLEIRLSCTVVLPGKGIQFNLEYSCNKCSNLIGQIEVHYFTYRPPERSYK